MGTARATAFCPTTGRVMTGVALLLACVAAVYDLRTREIPDWIAASLGACAVLATAAGWTDVTSSALLYGALLGFALSFPLFALGGFGGGDVKLVVALGAALGPASLLSALFWVAMWGGVLALVAIVRGRRIFAYAPAIALGVLAYWVEWELVHHAAV
jgi:prepilin peptidase CpaA